MNYDSAAASYQILYNSRNASKYDSNLSQVNINHLHIVSSWDHKISNFVSCLNFANAWIYMCRHTKPALDTTFGLVIPYKREY